MSCKKEELLKNNTDGKAPHAGCGRMPGMSTFQLAKVDNPVRFVPFASLTAAKKCVILSTTKYRRT